MRGLKYALIAAAACLFLLIPAPKASAQVSFGVQIGGPAPMCPYGYFDYSPYDCAPYGYYGPDWFDGGVFIGAGPWFHGPHGFHGSVNRHFDPRAGYHGALPGHGAYHAPADNFHNFHASHMSDGHGHFSAAGHGHGH